MSWMRVELGMWVGSRCLTLSHSSRPATFNYLTRKTSVVFATAAQQIIQCCNENLLLVIQVSSENLNVKSLKFSWWGSPLLWFDHNHQGHIAWTIVKLLYNLKK